MTLPVPYGVYGYVYHGDGSTIWAGITVQIADTTTPTGTKTVTTDAYGKYYAVIMDYADADGDTIQVTAVTGAHSVSETFTLNISDAMKRQDITLIYTATLADTITISDSFADATAYSRALADTLTLSDSFADATAYSRVSADTISVSDALTTAAAYSRVSSDTLTVSDSLTTVAVYNRALADTLSISDALTTAAAYSRALGDTLTISDALATAAAYSRALADTLALSDSLSTVFTLAATDFPFSISSLNEQLHKIKSNKNTYYDIDGYML